jgi:hypothetical protein
MTTMPYKLKVHEVLVTDSVSQYHFWQAITQTLLLAMAFLVNTIMAICERVHLFLIFPAGVSYCFAQFGIYIVQRISDERGMTS